MNKKRKILTLVALALFSAIIVGHCVYYHPAGHFSLSPVPQPPWAPQYKQLIEDVRMPLFALAVFYAGLFAILGDNKRKEQ